MRKNLELIASMDNFLICFSYSLFSYEMEFNIVILSPPFLTYWYYYSRLLLLTTIFSKKTVQFISNSLAISLAVCTEGNVLSFSILVISVRSFPIFAASSCWVSPFFSLNSRKFNISPSLMLYIFFYLYIVYGNVFPLSTIKRNNVHFRWNVNIIHL